MNMLLADTDVLIDFLKGNERAIELVGGNSEKSFFSRLYLLWISYCGAILRKRRVLSDIFLK
jgi:predicted nucleic acid-binding protein